MERLQKKHLEKMKEEKLAGGIAVDDVTELETLIGEIRDEEKLAEESRDSDGALKRVEEDRQAAEEMPKRAMERFAETNFSFNAAATTTDISHDGPY